MNWHAFKLIDRFFLLDVLSNSLFTIDEPTYRYLTARPGQEGEGLSSEACREIRDELHALKAQGYLKKKDPFLDKPVFNLRPGLKALCLHLAHDCQLTCAYCFAGSGAFGGDRSLMPLNTAKAAVDFLLASS